MRNDTPLFSIIVPVYNVEKYLNQCVDSILKQTYDNYEIILIDDGSTDSSGKICEEYKRKVPDKINVIHQKNGGLSKARNVGLSCAKGEYVLFLDSDDFLLKEDVVEKLADSCCGQDMIAFEWKEIFEGDMLALTEISYQDFDIPGTIDGASFLEKILDIHPGIPWYSWMYAYKRAYIQEKQFVFQEGRAYEDILFTPRAVLNATAISILPYRVYGYRRSRLGSITATVKYKNLYDHLFAAASNVKMVQAIRQLNEDLKRKLLSNFAEGYFSVMINVYALANKEDRKKITEDLREYSYLALYACGKKQVMARKIMNTFGMMPAIWLLNARRVLKRRLGR